MGPNSVFLVFIKKRRILDTYTVRMPHEEGRGAGIQQKPKHAKGD